MLDCAKIPVGSILVDAHFTASRITAQEREIVHANTQQSSGPIARWKNHSSEYHIERRKEFLGAVQKVSISSEAG